MTREEILAMKPGWELDALVHTRVLGKCLHPNLEAQRKNVALADDLGDGTEYVRWLASYDVVCKDCGAHLGYESIPCYSASIAAAWQVVEHLDACLHLREHGTEGRWEAHFCALNEHKECGHGDTAAEAICKAALLAVMGRDA